MKKKQIKTKEEARAFFQKIIDVKNAIIACIENGGDLKTLTANLENGNSKPVSVH